MALKPGQQRRPELSLSQFKEKVTTKRKIENLQKKQQESPKEESKELVVANTEPQLLNTGGYKAKQRPARENLPPEKVQEMLDNHTEILKKHEPKIQERLRFLQKTRS